MINLGSKLYWIEGSTEKWQSLTSQYVYEGISRQDWHAWVCKLSSEDLPSIWAPLPNRQEVQMDQKVEGVILRLTLFSGTFV
jgi:hypothetical protein